MDIIKYPNLEGHALRSGEIDHVLIHHEAGNLTNDTCYNTLKKAGSSCNYAIDSNGVIAQFLEEKYEPYTSSNRYIDDRAVTIEVANDSGAPNWHVSDKALKSLILLVTDICKRNNIKKLNYTGDRNGNLEKHSYYWPTACPGPYLGSKFTYIQDEVNKGLNSVSKPTQVTQTKPTTPAKKTNEAVAKEVINGKWGNGEDRKKRLKNAGYDYNAIQKIVDGLMKKPTTPAKKSNTQIAYEIIRGQGNWGNGEDRKKRLKNAGYDYNAIQKIINEILG